MLTISTIPEALAELAEQTGRAWTDSELFDLAANYKIELHAAPPITAQTTIQKFVNGVGMVEVFRSVPGHSRLAVLFPWQVGQLWLSGETMATHTEKHDEIEGEYQWFTEPVRVTREQIRIKAEALCKVLDIWRKANPAPEQSPATLAPVPPAGDSPAPLTRNEIASCFAGLREWDEERWKNELSSPDDWLKACQQRKGTRGRGGFESTWWPVEIATALIDRGDATIKLLRARFKSQKSLKPWFEVFATYYPDES